MPNRLVHHEWMANPPQKKRHHHTPAAYLRGFTDSGGRVFAWRKDAPETTLHTLPEEIGFEKYYYSQLRPDGGRDNNTLEDFFSTVEAPWPPLVERLSKRKEKADDFLSLIEFLMLQRVRGPATRDAVELRLAEAVKLEMRIMDEAGQLPPRPKGLELDQIEVSIDPHMSLHAFKDMLAGFARVVDACVFQVLHNQTSIDFITSDNPVMVLDPRVPEARMQPYQLRRDLASIELLFPLTSRMMLRGVAGLRFAPGGVTHHTVNSDPQVKRANRLSARFAYKAVFASNPGIAPLVAKHAAHSPVPLFERVRVGDEGYFTITRSVWGPRPVKPKWNDRTTK